MEVRKEASRIWAYIRKDLDASNLERSGIYMRIGKSVAAHEGLKSHCVLCRRPPC